MVRRTNAQVQNTDNFLSLQNILSINFVTYIHICQTTDNLNSVDSPVN